MQQYDATRDAGMRCNYLLGLSLLLFFAVACTRDEAPFEPAEPAEAAAPAEAAVPAEPPAPAEAAAPDTSAATSVAEPDIPVGDNSRNSLDWAGSYSGVLPCGSCPGIETLITLREDGTFDRSTLYIDESSVPEIESGRFSWNAAGSVITLDTGTTGSQQYQVGEGALFHLDEGGKRITEPARRYVLEKHVHDPAIEDKHWTLVELHGKPVESGARSADLTLRASESVAGGSSSCNSYSGGYAIKSGQRIRFARNMAVTMMACADMSIEAEFLEVLGQADNYTVGEDGTLSLNRARMAPLARFAEGGQSTFH